MNQATHSQDLLYEQDFLLWLEDTAAKLKARDFEHLDLDHLVEEIESLGRSERRELRSSLRVLLIHLLKRLYVDSAYDNWAWELTIATQRSELRQLLQDSPSLKPFFTEIFAEIWEEALTQVRLEYAKVPFPAEWQFDRDINALLSNPFWHHSN